MGAIASPAIVLRKMDFGESSRIVWLFTKSFGRCSVLARGAHRPRSRFQGALDLFHEIDATLAVKPERELQLLTGATVLQAHAGLGRNPLRLATASLLVELAGAALPEGRPDPALYELLSGGLALAEKFPLQRIYVALRAWQSRLLDLLGMGFALDRCAVCGTPLVLSQKAVGFAVGAGGALCEPHAAEEGARPVPAAVVQIFKAFRSSRAGELARLPLVERHYRTAARLLDEALERRLEVRCRARTPFFALATATLAARRGADDQPGTRAPS